MIDLNEGKTGLVINLSCMNSIFGLKNQDIIININNESFSKKIGKHFFELPTGFYSIKISTQDLMGETIDDQTIDVEIKDNFKCFIDYKIDFFMKSSILFDKCILNNTKQENKDAEISKSEGNNSNEKLHSIAGGIGWFLGRIVGFITGFFRFIKR